MSINASIQPGTATVTEIITAFREGKYYVDDSFQRRLVWVEKQKVRLIETILMGYPIPEIYLHQQVPDPNDGSILHSIVDGQQRINCLIQFASNEWSITAKHLDEENREKPYANASWNDLPIEIKNLFWNYSFNVRKIPSSITTSEIRLVFKRLNETDKSLNPQEIRHAEFEGLFIKSAEDLANDPFWRKYEVFNDNNLRRMVDVEFTTSLLAFLHSGIITDTTKSINDLYDLFNETYEDQETDTAEVRDRLRKIDEVIRGNDQVSSFFSKPVHLFTLFGIIWDFYPKLPVADLTRALAEFVECYEGENDGEVFARYRSGSIQRTRSKGSRELRYDALHEFLSAKIPR